MYTVEEIEKKAKASQRTALLWCVLFCVCYGAFVFFVLMTVMPHSYNPYGDNTMYYLAYLSIFVVFVLVFTIPDRTYKLKKKELMEKNEEEERKERDKHYRKMEELLEKMSKEKENK